MNIRTRIIGCTAVAFFVSLAAVLPATAAVTNGDAPASFHPLPQANVTTTQVVALPGDAAMRAEAPTLIAAAPVMFSTAYAVPPRSVDVRPTEASSGSQWPEPGPASAIIATLALAVFFVSRRVP